MTQIVELERGKDNPYCKEDSYMERCGDYQ
jgi:hypothetical protein